MTQKQIDELWALLRKKVVLEAFLKERSDISKQNRNFTKVLGGIPKYIEIPELSLNKECNTIIKRYLEVVNKRIEEIE
jgi:hypothetical protein